MILLSSRSLTSYRRLKSRNTSYQSINNLIQGSCQKNGGFSTGASNDDNGISSQRKKNIYCGDRFFSFTSSSNLIHHTCTSSLLLSLSLNNNGRFRSRYFSSESQSQQTKVESEESPNIISRTELRDVTKKDTANGASKIKLFVHKYGIVFVVTCTCVYLTALGSSFFFDRLRIGGSVFSNVWYWWCRNIRCTNSYCRRR